VTDRPEEGGGNCNRVPAFSTNANIFTYGNCTCPLSEMGHEAESRREVIGNWPNLRPHILQAILALMRTAGG
jgi:hypothetical protein